VLIFQTGAPSQIDTLDPKPQAPEEVRGVFKPIDTAAPGVQICEHLPELAARADKFAIVRSMTHGLPSHEHATHMMLTGINTMPPAQTHMASRADWPCYASGLDIVRPRKDGVPSGVMLPTYLNKWLRFCGQNDRRAWPQVRSLARQARPERTEFPRRPTLALPLGLSADRIGQRRALHSEINSPERPLSARNADGWHEPSRQGVHAPHLTAASARRSTSTGNTPKPRDRYGRQPLRPVASMARRLVQAGVPVDPGEYGSMNNWDTHADKLRTAQDAALAAASDKGLSAFLDDLAATGHARRDHWW